MSFIKTVFIHTIMVSTAVLFGIGIVDLIDFFTSGIDVIQWPWYFPLSIIFSGFLCSIPNLLLLNTEDISRKMVWIRIGLHFILIGIIVSLCGFLFNWYESLAEYLVIMIMYMVIYGFVWIASNWLAKIDEKKINDAIKDLQDLE